MKQSAPAPQTEEAPTKEEYAIGNYRFLPSQHQLCYGEERQTLTPKEAQILEMLCRRKGQVVRRDDILTAVWKTADFYSSRSLDVFITKLRKYLSQDSTVTLKSLKGVGVCLED